MGREGSESDKRGRLPALHTVDGQVERAKLGGHMALPLVAWARTGAQNLTSGPWDVRGRVARLLGSVCNFLSTIHM